MSRLRTLCKGRFQKELLTYLSSIGVFGYNIINQKIYGTYIGPNAISFEFKHLLRDESEKAKVINF
jgi:hypothetical protein